MYSLVYFVNKEVLVLTFILNRHKNMSLQYMNKLLAGFNVRHNQILLGRIGAPVNFPSIAN